MALLTTATDTNLVQRAGRMVTYNGTPASQTVSGVDVVLFWTYARTSTESFEYVGMTKSAAEAAAQTLQRQYTRKYARWTANVVNDSQGQPQVVINQQYALSCTSSIAAELAEGDSWSIRCSINEQDVIISKDEITDVDELEEFFQLAIARESSGSVGYIAVTGAEYKSNESTITAKFDAVIPSFAAANLGAQTKTNGTWTNAIVTARRTNGIDFTAHSNQTFRVSYDRGVSSNPRYVYSREWTTSDQDRPSITPVRGSFVVNNMDTNYSPSVTVTVEYAVSYNLGVYLGVDLGFGDHALKVLRGNDLDVRPIGETADGKLLMRATGTIYNAYPATTAAIDVAIYSTRWSTLSANIHIEAGRWVNLDSISVEENAQNPTAVFVISCSEDPSASVGAPAVTLNYWDFYDQESHSTATIDHATIGSLGNDRYTFTISVSDQIVHSIVAGKRAMTAQVLVGTGDAQVKSYRKTATWTPLVP